MPISIDNFTMKAREAIQASQASVVSRRQDQWDVEHLCYGLLEVQGSNAVMLLRDLNVNVDDLRQDLRRLIDSIPSVGTVGMAQRQVFITPRLDNVLEHARSVRDNRFGDKLISIDHILIAIVEQADGELANVLAKHGVTAEPLYAADQERRKRSATTEDGEVSEEGAGTLEDFAINLSEMAARGKLDPIVGRDVEIQRVIQTLMRRTKNNPVLIGDAGVGKTAIAEGLAQHLVSVPEDDPLYGKVVWNVDMGAMLAGTTFRGEFEERLKGVMDEAMASEGQIILFIDEIHKLVGGGTGSASPNDAGNMMKPALGRGDLQVVGATTPSEYRTYIERDAALERRFTPVWIEEPDEDTAVEMLQALKPSYETHHGVDITDEGVRAAVRLSDRYIADRQLPDKAVDLMDEAMAKKRLGIEVATAETAADQDAVADPSDDDELDEAEEPVYKESAPSYDDPLFDHVLEYQRAVDIISEESEIEEASADEASDADSPTDPEVRPVIDEREIAALVSDRVGVPVTRLVQDEADRILHIEERMHKRVIGQHHALERVAAAIRRARVGLKDRHRPIGVFMFMGPTGVGKTEVAKALAEELFDDEANLVRIDMSEMAIGWNTSRLVGSTPGYVGYDDGGELTDAVRRRPFSVVLLDEIEKAHPVVHNLMLQMFDDGRLTDGHGRTVDFSNTVIIMTSNLGSTDTSAAGLGFGAVTGSESGAVQQREQQELPPKYERALKERFRPEFINRIDDVIAFDPLSRDQVEAILGKMIGRVQEHLAEHRVTIRLTDAATEWLVERGFDPEMGARPMERAIERNVSNLLTRGILQGEIPDGASVEVDVDEAAGARLRFTATPGASSEPRPASEAMQERERVR